MQRDRIVRQEEVDLYPLRGGRNRGRASDRKTRRLLTSRANGTKSATGSATFNTLASTSSASVRMRSIREAEEWPQSTCDFLTIVRALFSSRSKRFFAITALQACRPPSAAKGLLASEESPEEAPDVNSCRWPSTLHWDTMHADRSRNWRRGVSSTKSATSKTLWFGGLVRKSTSAPNFRGCNLFFGKSHRPDSGWGVLFS